MYQVEDEPIERLHLYVVKEDDTPSSVLPLALSFLSLALLLAGGVLFPSRPPLVRQTLTVPAILLPLQTFRATVAVIPTGVHIFPATRATGTLTITNGSVLAQHFPAGMLFPAANGVEVVTTASVDVPAGDGTRYGEAWVKAQAITAGASGNLAPFAIDAVYGTSLYIKNDQSFTGGNNASSVPVIQPQDRQDALTRARATLTQRTLTGLLSRPCAEHVVGTTSLHVAWMCQFVTYRLPSLPHLSVQQMQVIGSTVFLTLTYVPRPQHLETK